MNADTKGVLHIRTMVATSSAHRMINDDCVLCDYSYNCCFICAIVIIMMFVHRTLSRFWYNFLNSVPLMRCQTRSEWAHFFEIELVSGCLFGFGFEWNERLSDWVSEWVSECVYACRHRNDACPIEGGKEKKSKTRISIGIETNTYTIDGNSVEQ